MPDTKPGLRLDAEGVCSACRSNERKQAIDWDARAKELAALCDEIRGSNGNGYDCVVPVSGGKDSMYQAWMMRNVHRMKTLCVAVVPHLQTSEGIANLNTLVKSLDVDLIRIHLKHGAFKHLRRRNFLEMGEPNWADHLSVFSGVARVAYMYRVPLVVWGEDIAVEYGGRTTDKRVSSAEDLVDNDLIRGRLLEDFYQGVISDRDTYFYRHPDKEELRKRKFRSIYLGYYHNWDGYKHYRKSLELGFTPRRAGPLSGNVIDYDNIDEKLCEINIWFKFLKFGFWRPTDQCCYQIWNGRLTRDQAVEIVNAKQYEQPLEYLPEFLEFHQMREAEFWETVERFRNKDIWHKIGREWRLKVPLV
jgi:N-acetyl sugar amidotransferase